MIERGYYLKGGVCIKYYVIGAKVRCLVIE